jgi:RNA polymerase sigma-70 factor (sigma-E family)
MVATSDSEFEAFVRSHGRAWERYAFVLTGDPRRAEDLVQTVLLKAYRSWRRIVAVELPDAYVRRMITHAFLDQRRRLSSTEVPMAAVPERRSAEDPATGVADRDELRRTLDTLTGQQRAVLVLRHVEGLSDDDIATLLGCSVSTVRSHASRGRDRFAAALSTRSASARGTNPTPDDRGNPR